MEKWTKVDERALRKLEKIDKSRGLNKDQEDRYLELVDRYLTLEKIRISRLHDDHRYDPLEAAKALHRPCRCVVCGTFNKAEHCESVRRPSDQRMYALCRICGIPAGFKRAGG